MKLNFTRVRWFSITPFSKDMIRDIATGMLSTKFDPATGLGFLVQDIRDAHITARFIRREYLVRSVMNADGEIEEIRHENYSSSLIRIFLSSPQIEVINPPKRLSEMETLLGDFLNNKVSIKSIEADCSSWINALEDSGLSLHITRLVTGNINLDDSASFKGSFSGIQNISQAVKSFLRGKSYALQSAAGSIQFENLSTRFKISATSGLTFASPPDEKLFKAIRNAAKKISGPLI